MYYLKCTLIEMVSEHFWIKMLWYGRWKTREYVHYFCQQDPMGRTMFTICYYLFNYKTLLSIATF